jgi:hypothetical protein
MASLGNVQAKVSCVFETKVVAEPSSKRSFQPFKVVAHERLRSEALIAGIEHARPSEKIDGTCAYIYPFFGKPWLWARHDRKPSKNADKKFKKFQSAHCAWQLNGKEGAEPEFVWNLETDLKEVPQHWVAASGVELVNGMPAPDENGHIPGWVPVDPKSRQHLWHLAVVDLDVGLGLFMLPDPDDSEKLLITMSPLQEYIGSTLELIGTNVNGNPYGCGTKQQPFHVLVRHGVIPFQSPPPQEFRTVQKWFEEDPEGKVEGIVWHCHDGTLFKLHRHHLGLKWPTTDLKLLKMPVRISMDTVKYEINLDQQKYNLFSLLANYDGHIFVSLQNIPTK